MSMLLGFGTLGFLIVLILGRMLTVIELRSRDREIRHNLTQISQTEEDLETSRRSYLSAIKSEGVAKHKVSSLKTRVASLRQHVEQLAITAKNQIAQKEGDEQKKLEALVMNLLGGQTVRRDSQFKRVMRVITQLVDLEKEQNSGDLMAAIRDKVTAMGKNALIAAAEKGGLDDDDMLDEPEEDAVQEFPGESETIRTPTPATRKDLVKDALKKKK